MSRSPDSTFPNPAARPRTRAALINLCGLLALPLAGWLWWFGLRADQYGLDLTAPPLAQPVVAQLRLNTRGGSTGETLLVVQFPASAAPQTLRFLCDEQRLTDLRLQPGPGGPLIAGEIHSLADETLGRDQPLATFAAGDWQPAPDAPAGDPAFVYAPSGGPLALGFRVRAFLPGAVPALAAYALAVLLAWRVWNRALRREPTRRRADAARAWLERSFARAAGLAARRPVATLWLGALAGVLLSCYPVVFCGKSFLSPNQGAALLYSGLPTVPGSTDTRAASSQGSDISATLWAFYPYGVAQRRAFTEDGEFPLWNRYNAGGVPLLGQGLSMIGDPIHCFVLLAGAGAGAWDIHYLLARLLFAAGVGLLVRAATGHLPAAVLLGFSACFVDQFVFRINHPAYFGTCYAPWLLYAWLEIARAATPGALARWTALLFAADWCEMCSGTVKEAYITTAAVNACGLLAFALAPRPWRWKGRVLGALAVAGTGFLLLTAPWWLIAADTIVHAWNNYAQPNTYQLQPGLFAGLFDDIFYRPFNDRETVLDPAFNFVVFLGVALALGAARSLARRERVFVAAGAAAVVALAFVFGVVPPGFINSVPFLANILHCDNTFTCAAFPAVFVVAGFGLARCWRGFGRRGWTGEMGAAAAVLGVVLGAYLGTTQAAQRSNTSFLSLGHTVALSPFVCRYVLSLAAAFLALPFLLRRLCLDRGATLPGVLPWVVLCLGALLWRHGQQLMGVGPDRYVLHPQARIDLQVPSPAAEFIRAQEKGDAGPARVQGVNDNLVPGFGGAVGLETPSSPDALQNPYLHRLAAQPPLRLIWDWRLTAEPENLAGQLRCLDALNTRYFLAPAGGAPLPGGVRPAAHLDLDVYESPTAWPRAFFTDALGLCRGPADFFAQVEAGDGRPFAVVPRSEAAAVSVAIPPAGLTALARHDATRPARQVVPASDYRLTNHTTTFRVHAPGPGLAVLLEAFAGGDAEVLVNGRPTPFFRVNEAFAAVYLDRAGDHEVVFRYRPRLLALSLRMAAGGALLLAAIGLAAARAQRAAARRRPVVADPPAAVPAWDGEGAGTGCAS